MGMSDRLKPGGTWFDSKRWHEDAKIVPSPGALLRICPPAGLVDAGCSVFDSPREQRRGGPARLAQIGRASGPHPEGRGFDPLTEYKESVAGRASPGTG